MAQTQIGYTVSNFSKNFVKQVVDRIIRQVLKNGNVTLKGRDKLFIEKLKNKHIIYINKRNKLAKIKANKVMSFTGDDEILVKLKEEKNWVF